MLTSLLQVIHAPPSDEGWLKVLRSSCSVRRKIVRLQCSVTKITLEISSSLFQDTWYRLGGIRLEKLKYLSVRATHTTHALDQCDSRKTTASGSTSITHAMHIVLEHDDGFKTSKQQGSAALKEMV